MSAERLHSLDGLRAVAALLVFTYHLGASSLGSGLVASFIASATRSGVELFFVLSAVVLARKYIREQYPLNAAVYFQRRAERLWPPYLVAWLLAGATIALTTFSPTWWTAGANLPEFGVLEWLSQVFIINWWTPYFNFAWWSLTVEVAFYILLPILIPVFQILHQRASLLLPVFLGVLFLAMVGYALVGIPIISDLVTYSSCFAAGLVLASRDIPRVARQASLFCGSGLVLGSILVPDLNPHVGWGLVYLGIVAAALDRSSCLAKLLSTFYLVWLGERSYSLFLTHYSVIALTCWVVSLVVDAKGVEYYVATRLFAVPFSLFVAMVVFSFVERYFANGLTTGDFFWPKHPNRQFRLVE